MVTNINIKKKNFINNIFNLTFFLISFSGVLSVFVVLSRMPYINAYFFKLDLNIFKKFLVFHVNFSLYFWMNFYIFFINIFLLSKLIKFYSFFFYIYNLIIVFFLFIFFTIFFKSEIFLINYIPLIKNNFFLFSFLLLFIVLLFFYFIIFLTIKRYKKKENKYFNIKKILIFIFFFYFINYFLIFINLFFYYIKLKNFENYINEFNYYELLIWSTGHCFQYINAFTLLIILFFFIEKSFFFSINSKIIFNLIVVYFAINLFFYLLYFLNLLNIDYYLLNTYLMKYNSFLYFIVVFILFSNNFFFCNFLKVGNNTIYFRIYTFIIFFMYFFGCFLGFLINKQNTIIPAHYHCSIGAVTLSFFVFSNFFYNNKYHLQSLNIFFYKYIPFLFFLGQFFFSLGFSIAGFYGSLRKSFINNQIINNEFEKIGLLIMAFGGIVAVFSGFFFVFNHLKIKAHKEDNLIWM